MFEVFWANDSSEEAAGPLAEPVQTEQANALSTQAARKAFHARRRREGPLSARFRRAGVDVRAGLYFFGSKKGFHSSGALPVPNQLHRWATRSDAGTEQVGPEWCAVHEHWEEGEVFEPFFDMWVSAALNPQAGKVLHDSIAGPRRARVRGGIGWGLAYARCRVRAGGQQSGRDGRSARFKS